ncbi:MAG TPA: DNA primase [Chthoniobacterales bacterium]
MGLISPETIEQVASATDIAELIGSYFPLKRAGTEYRALCPFHEEKTPSFHVSPTKQSFYCFGCGTGGSAFQFLMRYENVDFPEAVRRLARRAGIAVAESEFSPEEAARKERRSRLLSLHAEAAAWFHRNLLRLKEAEHARTYMQQRGLNIDVAKRWQIGYAPKRWDALGHWAQKAGYRRDELTESGLVTVRNEQEPQAGFYDRFRDRLMFPIRNDVGEVIAFSGRILDPETPGGKYVNSPETSLFTKGNVLFGFDKTKRAVAKARTAIVLEGQIDLITCFEAGVENVVAPQGTALTERHAALLGRFADEVLLFFDADGAGEKAAERALEVLYAAGLQVRIGRLPAGEDPDSLIRRAGAAAFQELAAASKDFFDFEIERSTAEGQEASTAARVGVARKLARFVGLVPDQMTRETMLSRLASRFNLPRPALEEMARANRREKASGTKSMAAAPPPPPLRHDLAILTNIALTDRSSCEWLRRQPWPFILDGMPGTELLRQVLSADFDPETSAGLATFLATLDPDLAAAASQTLALKPIAPEVRPIFWIEFAARELRERRQQLERILRLSPEGSSSFQVAQAELQEVLDHERAHGDILRLLTKAV